MLRRTLTLIIAAVLLLVFAVGGAFLRVPYLVAAPGAAVNTLGEYDGEQVIRIDGRESHEHDGGLSMVTVEYWGGPGARISLFTALGAWLSPERAVLPEEVVFPPDRTVDEVTESQTLQMDTSQQAAVAAALNHLDIDFEQRPRVAEVAEDKPAHGVLEADDLFVEVDGEPVETQEEVVDLVRQREPGEPVDLTIERDGATMEVTADTTASPEGDAIIGVMVGSEMDFPFEVDISVGGIGGPSAGMMFALGIVDHLSPEGLTGGRSIAGSGTIRSDGTVGAVSGVAQKMVSAEKQGADYFFVAAGACDQTRASAADDIEVVKIDDLDTAVTALEDIRSGDSADLPRCG